MKTHFAGYATQAELDAAYDVESSVPDFMVYAHKFMGDSEAARNALPNRLGVPYGPTLMETVDIFLPEKTGGKAPIMVFIHGGYWKSLTAREFSLVASGPVAAGFCVVVMTYALCPEVEIGEIVRQARAAVAWTARNAESFGGDPSRIFVAGHSAGGHLTATTLLTDWDRYGLTGDIVKGGIAISGLYNLEPLAFSFLQPVLRLTADTIRRESPILNIEKIDVPLVVAWGTAEPDAFSGQSIAFEAAWRKAGNSSVIIKLPGANHFEVLDGFQTAGGVMTRALLSLLDGKLPDSA